MFIIDTRASISITNDAKDFISSVRSVQPTLLKGIASSLEVKGIGSARYTFMLLDGTHNTVTLRNVLYVPKCVVRLLCPRHLADCTGVVGDGLNSLKDHGILTCNGTAITILYHATTGQPILFGHITVSNPPQPDVFAFFANITKPPISLQGPAVQKQNLTNLQRLKLLMHERCNHRNMDKINHWIRHGLLPVDSAIAACPNPICVACQLGKAHKQSHASNDGSITSTSHQPGNGVSADQLEAGHPGKIPTTKGLPTLKPYKYCNIWVDHHTRFIYPIFHETKHATKLQSKKEFQQFAAKCNVTIRCIRVDDGEYSAALFQLSCEQDNQDLTFCTVESHW